MIQNHSFFSHGCTLLWGEVCRTVRANCWMD